MGLYRKFFFYKRALQLLFAVNILIISSGVMAGLAYFSSHRFLAQLITENSDRLSKLSLMESDLLNLALGNVSDREAQYSYRRHLENLQQRLETWPDTNLAQILVPSNQASNFKLEGLIILDIQKRIQTEKQKLTAQARDAAVQIGKISKQLIIVGIATLILGILLPAYIFSRLNRELNEIKHKLEEKISHWMIQWLETYKQHGEQAYKDTGFWLNIILLSIESFAPKSRQPVIQFLAEFAPILRKHLNASKKLTKSPKPH